MMAAARRGSLDIEPAVKATGSNRELLQKNVRATDNWFRAKRALDREQRHYESKINMDKNALLKQRERLQSTSLTLDTVHEADNLSTPSTTPRNPAQNSSGMKRRMTLGDVYDSLIKSVREQNQLSNGDNRSVHSEPNLSKASTASFDSKKVARKPAKFSLQSLQRAQSNLQEKLQTLAQTQHDEELDNEKSKSEPATPRGLFDLSEDEMTLGPKLLLPPTTLPPIRSQSVFKPRSRSFDRPLDPSVSEEEIEDIKYCRYIRGAVQKGRRKSAPALKPGVIRRPAKLW